MARCRCSEATCNCVLTTGGGFTLTGSGSPTDPWVLTAIPQSTGTVEVLDTGSLDLVRTGNGVQTDPTIISGHVRLNAILQLLNTGGVHFTTVGTGTDGSPLQVRADLSCLDCSVPGNTGDVLTRQANGTYQPFPVSVPAGVIIPEPGGGIAGDGTVANPLRLDICTYAELKAACATP